jgi:hypothetical protein
MLGSSYYNFDFKGMMPVCRLPAGWQGLQAITHVDTVIFISVFVSIANGFHDLNL